MMVGVIARLHQRLFQRRNSLLRSKPTRPPQANDSSTGRTSIRHRTWRESQLPHPRSQWNGERDARPSTLSAISEAAATAPRFSELTMRTMLSAISRACVRRWGSSSLTSPNLLRNASDSARDRGLPPGFGLAWPFFHCVFRPIDGSKVVITTNSNLPYREIKRKRIGSNAWLSDEVAVTGWG